MDIVSLVKNHKNISIGLGIVVILIFLGGVFSVNPLTLISKKEPETKPEPAEYKVTAQDQDAEDDDKPPRPTPEELKKQAEHDAAFSEAVKDISSANSWFTKVPIKEEEFIIVYDYEEKKFRLALQIPSTSTPEKIDEVTSAALNALIEIDVDPEKEGFYTTFKE